MTHACAAGVDVGRIRAWLDACLARPLPKYETEALPEIDPDSEAQMVTVTAVVSSPDLSFATTTMVGRSRETSVSH